MERKNETKLLTEVLPNVAAQLRLSLGNLHIAMEHLAPGEGAWSPKTAILYQSYYRMLRLVNNISAAPMLVEEGLFPLENTEVCQWLHDLCRQAQPLFEEAGVALVYHTNLTNHIAAIHPTHLERLVWNLLSNALKFTPKGGTVTVSLRRSGAQLLLSVQDTGCGIREELVDTVFDRWLHPDQMDPQPHGLGLGLPLCRRIAEGHGGRLLLSSRVGEGTTVTAALPDKRCDSGLLRSPAFHYAGGFQAVVMELSDGLPYGAFCPKHLD